MTAYLGIDLAWGERSRTGLAVLDDDGRLTWSTAVTTDDEIAEFVQARASGDVVAAIDAPIVVPNASGRRECEAELQREFGPYDAGAHSTNRSHPWFDPPRAQTLARRLGWSVDPEVRPAPGLSVAIEVYPHPAMITLFGLSSVIRYKNKPGRTVESRRSAFEHLLTEMEQVCVPLRLDESLRWQEMRRWVAHATRPMHLGAVEDEVDAIFCAYLAWLWAQADPRMSVLGSLSEGYIVVPRPPRARPDAAASRGRADDGVPVTLPGALHTRLTAAAAARSTTVPEVIEQALDALGAARSEG